MLLACATPLAACLLSGVLVCVTGETAWVACLTTGVTVGSAEAVDVCVVAELPLPDDGRAFVLDVFVLGCPVLALEWPVPEEPVPAPDEPVPAEPVPAELVPAELVPAEPPPCWPEFTGEVTELTGFATVLTADPTDESTEDGADPGGGDVSRVDACACLENSIMMTKIPAATIASCIARMATRRAIGCGMSSSLLAIYRRMMARAARFPQVYATCPG